MSSYIIRPRLLLAALIASAALTAGCASGPKAPVKVIGVANAHERSAARVLLFLLEVRNPTRRQITLSQLDYQLEANPWFVSEGRVRVSRSIAAGGSAVLEVPVRLSQARDPERNEHAVSYTFRGVLRVHSGSVDRNWSVRVDGELAATTGGTARSAYLVVPANAQRR